MPSKTISAADLAERFDPEFELPPGAKGEIKEVSVELKKVAATICMMTEPGRLQSLALTHLENAIMYTERAILRKGA